MDGEVKDQAKANSSSQNPGDGDDDAQRFIREFWKWIKTENVPAHGWVTALSTIALLAVTAGQLVIACNNARDSSPLIGYAKDSTAAAQDNADAAQQFADSTGDLNRGIGDAVAKLSIQAAASKEAAAAAQSAAAIAKESLHTGDAAILIITPGDHPNIRMVGGNTPLSRPYQETDIAYKNIGRTPALSVVITPVLDFYGRSVLPSMPSYDGLTGDVIESGGSGGAIVTTVDRKFVDIVPITSTHRWDDAFMSIAGYIQYKDIFGGFHVTAFCDLYPYDLPKHFKQCGGETNWFDHPLDARKNNPNTRR